MAIIIVSDILFVFMLFVCVKTLNSLLSCLGKEVSTFCIQVLIKLGEYNQIEKDYMISRIVGCFKKVMSYEDEISWFVGESEEWVHHTFY